MNAASASCGPASSPLRACRVVAGDAHPPPAAAGRRLDQHRVADLIARTSAPPPRSSISPSLPGTIGTFAACASVFALSLLPSASIASTGGPMNSMLHVAALLGELGVLRQEAVAGVDRLGARHLGRGDDPRDLQVALGGPAGPMQMAWSASVELRRAAVGLGVHATASTPRSWQARITRRAISPRFATRIR